MNQNPFQKLSEAKLAWLAAAAELDKLRALADEQLTALDAATKAAKPGDGSKIAALVAERDLLPGFILAQEAVLEALGRQFVAAAESAYRQSLPAFQQIHAGLLADALKAIRPFVRDEYEARAVAEGFSKVRTAGRRADASSGEVRTVNIAGANDLLALLENLEATPASDNKNAATQNLEPANV